ncbi:LysR family transcriptional regulator [Microbulbifer taiwanensis]|uniref:LysR family transcriptional regulator n=1 Tax=Microbulbifer taiwanensis TaxID=986746 RepID=A0ABW1YN46_9GAMM|nr:LysR family transcriptional regulator [Microbulbifer taiwanensis]
MRYTHIRQSDLNLLLGLSVLLEERSVSRAAERFHLSQPAMSRMLQRLRETFHDELLVRTKDGYEPTARARKIQTELDQLLPRINTLLRGPVFDPSIADETFRIACTDYATVVMGAQLSERLYGEAPGITLDISAWRDSAFEDCVQGRLDLVLWVDAAPEPLVSEVLFREDFVCVMSAEHALAGRPLTLDDYLRYPHIVVDLLGGQQTLVEDKLVELGAARTVGLRVPYFSAAISAVAHTNLIATVPRRIASCYSANNDLFTIDAPLELAPFDYVMGWHPRSAEDPAHRWLRSLFTNLGRRI